MDLKTTIIKCVNDNVNKESKDEVTNKLLEISNLTKQIISSKLSEDDKKELFNLLASKKADIDDLTMLTSDLVTEMVNEGEWTYDS